MFITLTKKNPMILQLLIAVKSLNASIFLTSPDVLAEISAVPRQQRVALDGQIYMAERCKWFTINSENYDQSASFAFFWKYSKRKQINSKISLCLCCTSIIQISC